MTKLRYTTINTCEIMHTKGTREYNFLLEHSTLNWWIIFCWTSPISSLEPYKDEQNHIIRKEFININDKTCHLYKCIIFAPYLLSNIALIVSSSILRAKFKRLLVKNPIFPPILLEHEQTKQKYEKIRKREITDKKKNTYQSILLMMAPLRRIVRPSWFIPNTTRTLSASYHKKRREITK